MKNKLNLIIGKPEIGNQEKIKTTVATYTRFTLPFAFQLQAVQNSDAVNLYYELNDKDELSYIKRRKYFTRETADTLYEQGQWLSICDKWNETTWGNAEISITLRNQAFKIGMLAPQLILFETPEIKHQDERNILQTGLLYVDVYFPEHQSQAPQLDDLLVLNEYFRYFGIQNDFHAGVFKKIFSKIPVNPEKDKTIGELEGMLEPYFERWASLLKIPIKYNSQFFLLFPDNWAKDARKWMYNEPGSNLLEHWQIYADNRCYVWTAVFLEGGAQTLKNTFELEKTAIYAKDYGHWCKLLNIDTPSFDYADKDRLSAKDSHHSVSQFERQWAEERTYKRWEHLGTFFGFCYHGAAILAPPLPYIFSPSATYYFDTTALLFYIRLSLFRFGRELSKVIQLENSDQKRDQLRLLRDQFASFTVLYRFPMPSNQQQSIEMYEINRKFFDLDQFFAEIQQEIDNTHDFMETIKTNQQADSANKLASSANKLANLGIPLAASALLTALFSMNDFNLWECRFGTTGCSINIDMLLQVGLGIVLFVSFYLWKKNK